MICVDSLVNNAIAALTTGPRFSLDDAPELNKVTANSEKHEFIHFSPSTPAQMYLACDKNELYNRINLHFDQLRLWWRVDSTPGRFLLNPASSP